MLSYRSLIQVTAPIAAGANYASSNTIADVSPTVSRAFVAPGRLKPGSAIKLTAWGVFQNSGTTPTLLLGFYYGGVAGVALAASAAITTVNTATVNWPWRIEYSGIVRSDGATGTIIGQGWCGLATSLTAWTTTPIPVTAAAVVTIDTTVQKEITAGATWGTNSAANILRCDGFLAEEIA